jgi:phosphoglucomutase
LTLKGNVAMDSLALVLAGMKTVDADPALQNAAAKNVARWLGEPDFASFRPQLEWLIQEKKWAGLLDRFYQILPFGTGGRRGAVGVGPNRMNLWTLGASVQGHCQYLKERFPKLAQLKVVLAYDVRQFEDQRKNYNPALPNPVLHLSSKAFAQHAARIYAANGITAFILPENTTKYMATPELSYAIRLLGANGGLNVSASHNPPDDNGGKFYDERGGQPVPPDDQIMADIVEQVTVIKELPWQDAVRAGKIQFLDDRPHKAYIELCRKQSLVKPPRFDEIQIVFTPLHGVGSMSAMEVLVAQGFPVRPVEEQMAPDGQFPNVTQTPNPEVAACLDRAEALSRAIHADLALATDPDADRIGGLAPDAAGNFHVLAGNPICALLTHFKLAKLTELGSLPKQPIVVTTLVTTGLVTKIARHFNAQIVNNLLVGFKYIAEVLHQLERDGRYDDVVGTPADFIIGTEESHGAMVTDQIRDKDAAGAALLLAELALDQKRKGKTVIEYIDDMHCQFGYFHNQLRNIIMPGIEGKQNMARMLSRLRLDPPPSIGEFPVTKIDDLQDEKGWMGPFKGATDKQGRNLLHFQLGEFARIALRPSGTEPKAKAYIEVSSPPRGAGVSDEAWKAVCAKVDLQAQALGDAFVKMIM